MKIILSPIASFTQDTPPTVNGETLTYRGETYDLTPLPDGATVEADSPFVGNISRINGELQLTLEYFYDASLAEDNQPTEWEAYTFTVTAGQCPDPIIYKPVQPEPELIEVLNVD